MADDKYELEDGEIEDESDDEIVTPSVQTSAERPAEAEKSHRTSTESEAASLRNQTSKGKPSSRTHCTGSSRSVPGSRIALSSRKRNHAGTQMMERTTCRFYMDGKCLKGNDCKFSHNCVPARKPDLCKFYLHGTCDRQETCTYYHDDWPCMSYHNSNSCKYAETCKFSHGELTDATRKILERITYNEDSRPPPSKKQMTSSYLSVPSLLDIKVCRPSYVVPSLLDLKVYPPRMGRAMATPQYGVADSSFDINHMLSEIFGTVVTSNPAVPWSPITGFMSPTNTSSTQRSVTSASETSSAQSSSPSETPQSSSPSETPQSSSPSETPQSPAAENELPVEIYAGRIDYYPPFPLTLDGRPTIPLHVSLDELERRKDPRLHKYQRLTLGGVSLRSSPSADGEDDLMDFSLLL